MNNIQLFTNPCQVRRRNNPLGHSCNTSLWSPFNRFFSDSLEEMLPLIHHRDSSHAHVEEKDDHFVIEVTMPGVRKEDIKISIEKEYLSIYTDTETKDKKEQDNTPRHSAHSYQFQYRLPEHIDTEHITANLSHGILTLTLPKKHTPESTPHFIEIKDEVA